ncbi:MAG: HD domain-containing protein [Erysipelotrichaceae bacterium]|nr:HD domain-containing protein [Erysipelotrichaceae bacterium]
MNRYEVVKDELFTLLESKSHGFYKRNAYSHLIQVSTICIILARYRHLDEELAAIIGLLHDMSIAIDCNHFAHASRSSYMAGQLLKETQLFTSEEMAIITEAIRKHSNKNDIDDNYCELIKDADVIAHSLEGQALKQNEKLRYENVVKNTGFLDL